MATRKVTENVEIVTPENVETVAPENVTPENVETVTPENVETETAENVSSENDRLTRLEIMVDHLLNSEEHKRMCVDDHG